MVLFLMRACSKMGDVSHGAQLLQTARAPGAGVWCPASICVLPWSLAGIRTRARGAWLMLKTEQGSWETLFFFALGEAHLLWKV